MKCRDFKVSNDCTVGAFTTALIVTVSNTETNLSQSMGQAIRVPVWRS
jgi:hypothetical protein